MNSSRLLVVSLAVCLTSLCGSGASLRKERRCARGPRAVIDERSAHQLAKAEEFLKPSRQRVKDIAYLQMA
jgi:hypothetical protein